MEARKGEKIHLIYGPKDVYKRQASKYRALRRKYAGATVLTFYAAEPVFIIKRENALHRNS